MSNSDNNTPIALVTGAGSGIGRVVAHTLVQRGFHVVVCGRRQSALDETASLCEKPDAITAISCDVTDEQAVDKMMSAIASDHGRLDVVFNNAGTNVPAMPIDELSVEQWNTVINVNLTGAFLVARAAFGQMRHQSPQGGRIINNGSISAHVPRPGSVPYTVSKAAITGLTRTLSLDGRAFNIACGQIDIGNAASAMTAVISKGIPQADGSLKAEPTMLPEDVADAVAYMAGLSLSANVQFMTVMASAMPYIGRG